MFPTQREKKSSIVYNVLQTNAGWQIQSILPSRVSAGDRVQVLDWFHSYRAKVNELHPSWLTKFSASEHGYLLEVIVADDQRQALVRAFESLQSERQLEFDYV